MTKLIGTDPNQVPSNADLGDMAYQDSKTVSVDRISIGMQSSPIASNTDLYNNPALLVKHNGHGVAMDYVGSTLPYQAGLFTSSTAHTQTAYGDLNIKARTDYGGNYGIGFFTASSNNTPVRRAYFNSTGNLVFEDGKGIDFSASEGSGASSSVLTDYEEGTWTPYLNGVSAGIVYSTQAGTYTKIGKVVTLSFVMSITTAPSAGSNIRITMPFNARGSTYTYMHGNSLLMASGLNLTADQRSQVRMSAYQSGTDFYFYNVDTGGVWNALSNITTGTIAGSITYEVA